MAERYNFHEVEKKWQTRWEENETFKAEDFSSKPKYYVLSEFFGPSGKGIHLGHVKCFTPTEVIARYKRLKGYNVLYPVGWDAFGLPTENYALKMNMDPEEVTEKNVGIFKHQLKSMGFSFDWSREICTTDPGYYKFTQSIFLELFKHGMAYKAEGVVNFCPSCQTVLSNEDSQGGICDRCKSEVEQRTRSVWYLRMKDYSEKMLDAIDAIDMKENLKESQRNWIGKSTGAEIEFAIAGEDLSLTVFTTRPDTLYGVTFMVVSPEHPMISTLKNKIQNYAEVAAYIAEAAKKTAIDRAAQKDKTGVLLKGVTALNPATGKEIPVFAADYVMMGYGTGAIMAVPGHDSRDYAFAKKFGLDIVEVIAGGDVKTEAYEGDGMLVNSGILNGLNTDAAKAKMTAFLTEKGVGKEKVNYKMQDWPFNRQRYWGEPFPVIFCEHCGCVAVEQSDLPLTLPKINDMRPESSGNGPLSKCAEFVNVPCPVCGKPARRETDTMPNWAGSSWYWLRFTDPHNETEFADEKHLKYWGAVDLYTGGTEHVTRHMLYASFWHNFLFDIGKVPHRLPFTRRMCNGLILDEKGKKMGKSSGNAVDPIQLIEAYGADAFRLHVLFMGDYEQNTIWTTDGINGCTAFLNRVWNLSDIVKEGGVSSDHARALNTLIKRADEGIISDEKTSTGEHIDFKFNTVIAAMMEFYNEIKKDGFITKEEFRSFLLVLNPFAPHITSELYERHFGKDIAFESFPVLDESKLAAATVEIPVQQNGRLKGRVTIPVDADEATAAAAALKVVQLDGAIKKTVYVSNRIINFII